MSSPTWQHGSSAVADQTSLRRANLGLVLRWLRDARPRPRARLAADLRLNKATVSSLVAELAERGLVQDGGAARGAYLILREKVQAFRSDPEVQAALEAAEVDRLDTPTVSESVDGSTRQKGTTMTRPITLFTGQWADLQFQEVCKLASRWGYDGLEIACWGDHFDPWAAVQDDSYVAAKREVLKKYDLQVFANSNHLKGQAVCDDPIDERHLGILPDRIWGTATPRTSVSALPRR